MIAYSSVTHMHAPLSVFAVEGILAIVLVVRLAALLLSRERISRFHRFRRNARLAVPENGRNGCISSREAAAGAIRVAIRG